MTTELAKYLFDQLELKEQQSLIFIDEVLEDIKLFDKKQHDYGPQNIAAFGEKGVLVRTNDKMARLVNLLWTRPTTAIKGATFIPEGSEIVAVEPLNESIEDSWRDLSIYGVIARLCRKGLWKV